MSSYSGGYRYALILVDDHTRFKFVYFLKRKSDAPDRVKRFIASLNAHASSRSASPVRVVGSLHTDNAGEFLSHQFTELLDNELVSQTTCPPHVHALNGVAERTILSVMSLARSYLTSSNVASCHWPDAIEMAVDVLNRTSGPTVAGSSGPTSYELLTGERPRVLGILPFGCRAFAVKPRSHYSKTTIDPRAWVGVNLGRSIATPGAYKIYVPSTGRVVLTSDAYFMEGFYPSRPRGQQHDDVTAVPTLAPPDAAQPPGVPTDVTLHGGHAARAEGLAAAYREAVGSTNSRRVLILFSGPYDRPDGIAAFLRRRGIEVDLVDSGAEGGGGEHDILNDAFFIDIYERIRAGTYGIIFTAPPCSTYSIARFFTDKPGPPAVRDREHILGLPDVPAPHRRELHRANELTRRTAVLLSSAHLVGADFIIENPSDRGDPSSPWLFQEARHGPIWLDPHFVELWQSSSLVSATFAQCMLGASSQKYTTFWYSSGLSPQLNSLKRLICTHPRDAHATVAGGVQGQDGKWNSAATAAYPAELNLFIADAILSRLVDRERDKATDAVTEATTTSPDPQIQPVPSYTPPETPEPAPAIAPAAAPVEPDSPPEELTPPSPHSRRRKKEPHELFRRGLGAIRTRSSGSADLAKKPTGPDDPINHDHAIRLDAEGWGEKGAEGKEILNHHNNKSWSYILSSEKPRGRHIIKLTWVYKVKRDGTKKARLCVQGCTQRPGVDYDQTFCAAMRAGSLRLLSSLAGRLDLNLRRWDFVAAYLQGSLEPGEVVYCSPPPGYATALGADGVVRLVPRDSGDGVDRLCRVEKPVYGMAQSGRRWQRSIFPWITGWNADRKSAPRLRQSVFDKCVFYCHHVVNTPSGPRRELLLIGCYVDDLYILSTHTDEYSIYHQFTSDLSSRWEVEDEGEVADLLSVEISKEEGHVVLRQRNYIRKMLLTHAPDGVPTSPFGSSYQLSSHPASRTPASEELPQLVLDAVSQDVSEVDPVLLKAYQSLVGALLYCVVNTRPDVAYSVGLLCRAMGKPTPALYLAALRVLYYLHHHQDIGLRYGVSDLDMSGMSDSDWAVKHSTTGYVFTYAQAAISWGSRKQSSIALSSCEAEIVALSEASKESVYLSRFLTELGFGSRQTPRLATDNSGARDLSYNPEHHEKVKHVERRHFYIRELVENEQLVVPYVKTSDNLADFFTKPLDGKSFFRFRNEIMNVDRASVNLARAARRDRHRTRRAAKASVPATSACPADPPVDPNCAACGGSGQIKDSDCVLCFLSSLPRVRFAVGPDAPVRSCSPRRRPCRLSDAPSVEHCRMGGCREPSSQELSRDCQPCDSPCHVTRRFQDHDPRLINHPGG